MLSKLCSKRNRLGIDSWLVLYSSIFKVFEVFGRTGRLDVGLHLNLTEGPPLTRPALIPSLVIPNPSSSSDLQFANSPFLFRGKHGFRQAMVAGLIDARDIVREVLAQYRWFIRHSANQKV